jgi:hypothetical protein
VVVRRVSIYAKGYCWSCSLSTLHICNLRASRHNLLSYPQNGDNTENFKVKLHRKKCYIKNSKLTLLKLISGLATILVLNGLYIRNYSEPKYEIWTTCTRGRFLGLHTNFLFETSQEQSYSDNPKMTKFKNEFRMSQKPYLP